MVDEQDRVILVTGAASGMGRALVERLARQSRAVVAVDVKPDGFGWAAELPTVLPFVCDVSTEAGNREMVEAAVKRFGGLDGVVLNAAVSIHGDLLEMPMADFDRMHAVNTRGVALGIRAAVPALRARGGGAMVVTASQNAFRGSPQMWAYDSSKGGVLRLAQSAAIAVAKYNIRINVVCPGATRGTGMTGPREQQDPQRFAEAAQSIPLKRWGEAHEIAAVMEFLLSPAASYVTAAAIPVDGGLLASLGLQRLPAWE